MEVVRRFLLSRRALFGFLGEHARGRTVSRHGKRGRAGALCVPRPRPRVHRPAVSAASSTRASARTTFALVHRGARQGVPTRNNTGQCQLLCRRCAHALARETRGLCRPWLCHHHHLVDRLYIMYSQPHPALPKRLGSLPFLALGSFWRRSSTFMKGVGLNLWCIVNPCCAIAARGVRFVHPYKRAKMHGRGLPERPVPLLQTLLQGLCVLLSAQDNTPASSIREHGARTACCSAFSLGDTCTQDCCGLIHLFVTFCCSGAALPHRARCVQNCGTAVVWRLGTRLTKMRWREGSGALMVIGRSCQRSKR